MTPPATAAARSRSSRPVRTVAPRTARRVSGPARTPLRGTVRPSQGAALALPLGLVLVRRAAALPDARLLDRLARGRLWIALLAIGLFGVVFLQISLLKLNTGISRGVQTAQTLERQNTELKLNLSRLGGGERIQDSAAAMGFVVPVTGQPKFLDAAKASATRAAANVAPPAPIQQLPLGMIPPAEGGSAAATSDAMSPTGSSGNAAAPLKSGANAVAADATSTAAIPTPTGTTPITEAPAAAGASSAAPVPAAPITPPHAASGPANAAPATAPASTAHAAAPVTVPSGTAPSHAATAGGATAAPGG